MKKLIAWVCTLCILLGCMVMPAGAASNETTIYNFLRNELGCNVATACGILANIEQESSFDPNREIIDTNGLPSYGICQWNGDRFTALKNYCGSSYTTLSGQLQYLKYELNHGESYAWSKMQGIANNSDGAYTAGYRWAQYFERCAEYYNGVHQYSQRGNKAVSTYWAKYGGTSPDTGISLSGQTAPTKLDVGQVFILKGTISSGATLTSVTVGVFDQASGGTMKTGRTVTPNSTSYNIANVDAYVEFNKLPAGTYYYRITAANAGGTKTLLNQMFTVGSADYSISLSGETKPTKLDVGQVFILKGIISSGAPLTSVTVGVFDQASGGTMKTGRTVTPNSTSYNIANVDAYVEFNKLAAGTYYYRITATNAGGTKTLLNQMFTVGSVDYSISLSGQTAPTKLDVGQVFILKGTISSGAPLTSVTVGVFDQASGGTMKTGRTVTPNSTSYNIANVDAYVEFNKLAAGTYYYRITAANAGGTKTLLNQEFTVGSSQQPVVAKPSNVTVSTDKSTYTLGETVTITPSATGATQYSYRVCYGTYGDDTTKVFEYGFTGNRTFVPDKEGTYIVRVSAINEAGYTDGECSFVVSAAPIIVDQEGVHFERQTIYFLDQFKDVPAEQWFTKSVASAFELGLMKGNSATTFNPYGDVTIAEAITMAARIHSIYMTGSENFVQNGKWYQVYLDYALENGIITKDYYNSDVNHKATRAQFAEIFANSLPDKGLYPMNSIGENAIPDVKSTDSYAPYVYKLYRAGILTGGDAKGTFSPGTYITRAESAAIVSRMAESNNRVAFHLQ